MRRQYWTLVILVMPTLLLLWWVVPLAGRDDRREVRRAVHAYLVVHGDLGQASRAEAGIRQIATARRPWLFNASVSQASYHSNVLARSIEDPDKSARQIDATLGYTTHYGYIEPDTLTAAATTDTLSYPPRRLWCVWLHTSPQAMLFVGEHHALYTVDWIVHVPAKEVPPAQVVEAVDCQGP